MLHKVTSTISSWGSKSNQSPSSVNQRPENRPSLLDYIRKSSSSKSYLSTLQPLYPVLHLILKELERVDPVTVARVSRSLYADLIPTIYSHVGVGGGNATTFRTRMEIWRGRPRPLEIGGSEKEDGLGQKKKREGLDQAVAVPRPNPTQHTRVLSLVDWEGYYTLCYQDSHFEPPNTTPLSAHLHLPASLLVTASATSLAQRPGGGPHHLFANRSPLSYFSRNTLHYIVPVAVCVDIPTWEELMELDKYELLNMGLRECLELDMQEMLRLLFKGLPRVTFHVRASKGQLFPVTMLETTWERNGCEVTYDIEISEEDPMQTRVIAKQVVAAFARIYSYSGRRKPRFIVPYRKELPELVEDMLMKYREPMRTKCRESITMRGEGGEECVCKTPMCPRGLLPVMVHDERPREVPSTSSQGGSRSKE